MNSMDAKAVERTDRQRQRWAWILGLLAVAGLALGMNRFWGPTAVDAQTSPARSKSGNASAPSTPSASPSLPGKTAPNASGSNSSKSRTVAPAAAVSPAASGQPAAPGKSGLQTTSGSPSAAAAGRVAPGRAAPGGALNGQAGTDATPTDSELKIVALINGEQITRQDLARECVLRFGKEVLESQVNKHLIYQACLQRNIKISEQDVTDEIERIAKKFGLSTDRWLLLLEQERGVGPVEYRSEIIWPALALKALSADQLVVAQDELKKAFESEFGEKVRVRVISVSSRKRAEELWAKAQANPDAFPSMAKDHSEDPSASVMGVIPPIRKNSGVDNLEKAAFKLKPGQISPVVQVANQYMILRCEEHINAVYLAGEQLQAAQSQITEKIREQKMRTAANDLFKKLQTEAKVVNVLNDANLQKQHPGVAALINNKPLTMRELSEECIKRHGKTVLDGEINRKILQMELKRLHRTVDDSDIQEEVARAAESYGYLKEDKRTPDVEGWLKAVTENDNTTIDVYVRDAVWPSAALKKLIGTNVQITEEDVKKGFEANYGERVEIMAIVISNQRQAQQVWEMARDNASESFFGELAQQYSIEPASRANSGRVPPLRRHSGQPVLEDAAFKLKAGELSPILSVGDKFVILKCLGRTKPVVSELTDEVRQELTGDLIEKKLRASMNKEFDRLKEEAQVDNFLAGSSQPGKRSKASSTPDLSGTQNLEIPTPRSATKTPPPPRAGSTKR
jgi:parvulin-like peptidyl-prolyl isomerase